MLMASSFGNQPSPFGVVAASVIIVLYPLLGYMSGVSGARGLAVQLGGRTHSRF